MTRPTHHYRVMVIERVGADDFDVIELGPRVAGWLAVEDEAGSIGAVLDALWQPRRVGCVWGTTA